MGSGTGAGTALWVLRTTVPAPISLPEHILTGTAARHHIIAQNCSRYSTNFGPTPLGNNHKFLTRVFQNGFNLFLK